MGPAMITWKRLCGTLNGRDEHQVELLIENPETGMTLVGWLTEVAVYDDVQIVRLKARNGWEL